MPSARPSARRLAIERLLRVEQDAAYVARLDGDELDAATARRVSDYVAGVTRYRRWLDFLLSAHLRGTLDALDPPLRQALRIGAYDLVVRGVPPHAAIDEAVTATREVLHRGAAGLANAVLRALARTPLPEPATGDRADDLAVRFSHPTWLVRRWLARWGEAATVALLRHDNEPPTFGLRVHTRRVSPEEVRQRLAALGVEAEPSRWLDDFLRVPALQDVLRGGLVREGLVAVQDEAAGLVVRVLDPQPGETLLDAAAAPGGKAVYAALRTGDRAPLTALDVNAARTRLIDRAAAAHGVTSITTASGDLRTADLGTFDRVLLDAPCSGTGVLSKRADLRWNRTEADLADLTALQDALLDAAARHVRPGGLLVYSTCAIEPEENDDRVVGFLERHPEFALESVEPVVPDGVRDGEVLRVLPHVHGTDGAFAARLRRAP